MTSQFFDANSRHVAHPGKWSEPRRNALATSILALSCQKTTTSVMRNTTLGLPALKMSDRCQVTKTNLCVGGCLRVARACINLKNLVCLANPLGSYFWKLSGLQNLTNKCVVLDVHLCAFDHTGEEPLVLFSEDSLTVLVFTAYIPAGSDVTESMDCVASAKGTNICSCKAI